MLDAMLLRRSRIRMLTWAAVLLMSVPVQARHRTEHSARPGGFDYYLLSLSVAPSFCMLTPSHQASGECRSLTRDAFQQTPLTVHGLWPNRANASVNQQPHDCAGAAFQVPEALQGPLARYMPGGPELAEHEWRKHGSCSGLSPEAYFSRIVSLAQNANDVIGEVMRERGMLGTNVRIADLLSGVAARDPALANAIVVSCRIARGGGDALVEEIRVVLAKDFTPRPARDVGMGQNSGCPRGTGRVPEPGTRS